MKLMTATNIAEPMIELPIRISACMMSFQPAPGMRVLYLVELDP